LHSNISPSKSIYVHRCIRRRHNPAHGRVVQPKSLADVFHAVAAGLKGLGDGRVALGQGGEVGQRRGGCAALEAWDFLVSRCAALELLAQLGCKLRIA
jgi:hypothetical protein